MDIWDEWLARGRYEGTTAEERALAAGFIATVRQTVETYLRLRPGESVLEVGCGTGEWLPRLLAATGGGSVVALDASRRILAQARDAVGRNVCPSDAERMRWLCQDVRNPLPPDLQVNAVCGRAVLQYTGADLASAVSHLRSALLPQGRLGFFEMTPGDDLPPMPQDLPRGLRACLRANWRRMPWRTCAAHYWRALNRSQFRTVQLQHFRERKTVDATAQLGECLLAARPCAGEGPLGEVLFRGLPPVDAERARDRFRSAARFDIGVSWCLLSGEA